MITCGVDVNRDMYEDTDVCIIGSGAAGAILVFKMAEAGHNVVLLEKGGYHPREDFTQREEEMIPKLFKNSGLQFTSPTGYAVAQGSCVGGSTVVNDAVCFEAPDTVLGWWADTYKVEEIEPSSLRKFYDEVEKRIHYSKVGLDELNSNNLKLKEGCEKLGWHADTNFRNCISCRQCGLCHLGCRYGTKQSMLETYIKDAQDPKYDTKVKLYADAQAYEIVKSGNRVSRVRATITEKHEEEEDGKRHDLSVKAKIVIVSGGTIASSELLLRSKIDVNDQVGKRVAIHPSPSMMGDFDEEINGNQGIPMAYHCYEFHVSRTGKRGYMLESVFSGPFQYALPLPGFSHDHRELMSRYNHYAQVGSLLQDWSSGTVSLGGPLGSILWYELHQDDQRPDQDDRKLMIEGMKSSAEVLFEAGAKMVITSHRKKTVLHSKKDLHMIDDGGVAPADINVGSAHPQGGNCMGKTLEGEPAVVDSYSQVYGFENLFVCDASVFPTSVGVNPQLTVMALAARAAEHINENWARYTGER